MAMGDRKSRDAKPQQEKKRGTLEKAFEIVSAKFAHRRGIKRGLKSSWYGVPVGGPRG